MCSFKRKSVVASIFDEAGRPFCARSVRLREMVLQIRMLLNVEQNQRPDVWRSDRFESHGKALERRFRTLFFQTRNTFRFVSSPIDVILSV